MKKIATWLVAFTVMIVAFFAIKFAVFTVVGMVSTAVHIAMFAFLALAVTAAVAFGVTRFRRAR